MKIELSTDQLMVTVEALYYVIDKVRNSEHIPDKDKRNMVENRVAIIKKLFCGEQCLSPNDLENIDEPIAGAGGVYIDGVRQ